MKNLKIFTFLIVFMISISFCVSNVKADCSDCSISNCADCGCVLSQSGTSCVYDNFNNTVVSCGDNTLTELPVTVPKIVSIVYILIQIAVPVILVIIGSIDLIKAIIAQKEDEIKKNQQIFIKRLITAALIFFLFVIVKFVISLAADSTNSGLFDCVECIIKNNDKCITKGGN